MYNVSNFQQKFAMDAYEDKREVEKERAKAIVRERIRMQAQECREIKKEQEEERKKAVHEEVQILSNGQMQIITRNLLIDTMPREFTNMEAPRIIFLKRQKDESDTVLLLEFRHDGCEGQIFLDPDMIGSGAYLIKKFASQGVRFYFPMAKKKAFLIEFISVLIENSKEVQLLTDNYGWTKNIDGHFKHVGEGELIWRVVKKRAK